MELKDLVVLKKKRFAEPFPPSSPPSLQQGSRPSAVLLVASVQTGRRPYCTPDEISKLCRAYVSPPVSPPAHAGRDNYPSSVADNPSGSGTDRLWWMDL